MDWKSLAAKLDPYIQKMDPLVKKLDPYVDKAKDAGFKALDFTQKQLQNTPLVLKNQGELDTLRTSKRAILIAYDESDELAREVLLRSPVWSTWAWSDAAELRFVEVGSTPDIVRSLSITTPLDMRVWYTGQETFHTTDIEAMKKWWKARCYDGSEGESASSDKKEGKGESAKVETSETPAIQDPLTEK